MSCKTLSEKKAESILDAARRLFLEHGFGATSMDQVAAGAGVSKATIYVHHKSKEALFAATVSRECERSMAYRSLGDDLEEDCSLRKGLTQIGRAYMKALTSPKLRGLARAVFAEVTRFPELGQIYYDSGPAVARKSMVCYLESAKRKGFLIDCDTNRAADQFLSLLRGDVYVRCQLGSAPSSSECDEVIAEAVITFGARYANRSAST